ncbi:MAG TPA: desulfoferrodoxin family protein [Oscillospiraceae bacterium]|nr:desulfoferrodoxin family protein [Oscillospiraceae bacterium]
MYSTACMISHRPGWRGADPRFYRCGSCGALGVEFGAEARALMPCQCGGSRELLAPSADADPAEAHRITYVIFGGAEHNAIRVWVEEGRHPATQEHHIAWIYLRTYTGGQLKFLLPGEKPTATFALADEDAYAYCDRPVCRMGRGNCQFQCKRGYQVYACCSVHGLRELRL